MTAGGVQIDGGLLIVAAFFAFGVVMVLVTRRRR